jgi:hypothetical protein
MPTATVVDDIVTTKEELEAWKKERAQKRLDGGQSVSPPFFDPKKHKPGDWQYDLNLLIQFLSGVKTLMRFLIDNRVPEGPSKMFSSCFPEIERNIDEAINDLSTIDSEDHVAFRDLKQRGCTGKPFRLKFREYVRRITSGPVPAVLERVDSILRSLFPVLATLEPVNEFKEALESRLKHDGDRGIISLNLSGNEQLWNRAETED